MRPRDPTSGTQCRTELYTLLVKGATSRATNKAVTSHSEARWLTQERCLDQLLPARHQVVPTVVEGLNSSSGVWEAYESKRFGGISSGNLPKVQRRQS